MLASLASGKVDPYLMIILPRMFESITREMSFTLEKTARSNVIAISRDFSSGIITGDGRLFMIEEGLPVHIGTLHLSVQETLKFFDDLAPGDCILNNCPFTGNTHHADFTIMVPVFYEDELIFWAVNRAHQADVGAPIPTTYPFPAKDIYEEGLHFPCVRVQRNYKDVKDILRICKMKIRVPEQWYGDYMGQVAAARRGERRIIELCEQYGVDTLKAFVEEWFDYSEKLMIEEIRKIPKATIEHEIKHDPPIMFPSGPYSMPETTPPVAEGIPLRVKIDINPDEARITVDLRDNIENQPFGFNMTYATTLAAVYTGIFNNLGEVPHNEGALRRIEVKLDEGKIVGKPRFPVGTSIASTNLCDRLVDLITSAFAKLGPPWGKAESNTGMGIGTGVISGYDWRRPGTPGEINYINQLIPAGPMGAGGAVYGHDGWCTYGIPVAAGVLHGESIELSEQRFPLMFMEYEIVPDGHGAGKWDGAPSVRGLIRIRKYPMTIAYISDGRVFPPRGVLGGGDGRPYEAKKIDIQGREIDLLPMGVEVFQPGELVKTIYPGGGGYGNPLERDPELVRIRVRDGWVSAKRALEVYGVVLKNTEDPEKIEVDNEATIRLREEMKRKASRNEL